MRDAALDDGLLPACSWRRSVLTWRRVSLSCERAGSCKASGKSADASQSPGDGAVDIEHCTTLLQDEERRLLRIIKL
jgi:hypothetical protein